MEMPWSPDDKLIAVPIPLLRALLSRHISIRHMLLMRVLAVSDSAPRGIADGQGWVAGVVGTCCTTTCLDDGRWKCFVRAGD